MCCLASIQQVSEKRDVTGRNSGCLTTAVGDAGKKEALHYFPCQWVALSVEVGLTHVPSDGDAETARKVNKERSGTHMQSKHKTE